MAPRAVFLTVYIGRSYIGNDGMHSTLLDRACACSYENLPILYRSYRVSNTAPCTLLNIGVWFLVLFNVPAYAWSISAERPFIVTTPGDNDAPVATSSFRMQINAASRADATHIRRKLRRMHDNHPSLGRRLGARVEFSYFSPVNVRVSD